LDAGASAGAVEQPAGSAGADTPAPVQQPAAEEAGAAGEAGSTTAGETGADGGSVEGGTAGAEAGVGDGEAQAGEGQAGEDQSAQDAESGDAQADQGNQEQNTEVNQEQNTNVNVEVTTEQRTVIRESIIERGDYDPVVDIDFDISIGTAVPRTITYYPLPPTIIELVPAWSGYVFFILADGRIVIIEPSAYQIVYVIAG
jgi:hypothetical protein